MQAAAKLAERDPPPLIATPTKYPSLSRGSDFWGAGPEAGGMIDRSERVGGSARLVGVRTSPKTAERVALCTRFSTGTNRELSGSLTQVQAGRQRRQSRVMIRRAFIMRIRRL